MPFIIHLHENIYFTAKTDFELVYLQSNSLCLVCAQMEYHFIDLSDQINQFLMPFWSIK